MDKYFAESQADARSMVENFEDEIVDYLINDDEAPDDLYNRYSNGDRYHHESHVDRCYDFLEAATILDQLSDYEESDSGLWEGLPPRRAIEAYEEQAQELQDQNALREAQAEQYHDLSVEFEDVGKLSIVKQRVLERLQKIDLSPETLEKEKINSVKKIIKKVLEDDAN